METLFTKIIKGEIPSYKIAETEDYFAFLDINPIAKGHALVIPKTPVDYIFNLSDETLTGLVLFAKKIAVAIEKAIPCERIGIAVIGLEVPHTHVHLVPISQVGDLDFKAPRLSFSKTEYEEILEKIKSYL